MRVFSNRKTVGAVIPFAPPAIQDAEVQTPVAPPFHAARPRGFQGPARRIQPDIAAGNHLPGHVDIVILEEDKAALQIAVFAQVDDVLNVTFAIIVAWMRFAGKNKLNWTRFVPG